MFDPNAPLPDFEAQQSEVDRRKLMAEMLRRRRSESQQPQGQMVGRIYVKPHWAEYLPDLLNAYQGRQAQDQATEAEKRLKEQAAEARLNWQSSLPRARAAIEGRSELPGPRAEAGSPELDPVNPVPAELPDRGSVLAATMKGMQIPGNKEAALLWERGMSGEIDREDKQSARREEKQAQLAQAREIEAMRLQQRAEEAERRSQDTRLAIEQRREAAAEAVAARRDIAALMAAVSRDKADKPKDLKPLPAAQAKAWTGNNAGIKFIDETLEAIKGNEKAFGLKNMLPEAITQRIDPAGVNARARVGNVSSLKIHDRSGAAVSAMEFPRLRPFIPDVRYDDAKTIAKKLTLFKREYELMQQEILDLAETQGYKSPLIERETPASDAAQETKSIGGKTYFKKNGQWFEK